MATFWFISAPLPGHLDWGGFLQTAQTLQARGHQVRWLSEAAISPLVTAGGIPFETLPATGWLWPPPPAPDFAAMTHAAALFSRYERALDTWLSEALIPPAVEAICAMAARDGAPDVMVTDPFLTASALAAERIGVPLAVAGWPAGQPLDEERLVAVQSALSRVSQQRVERLTAHFGLHGVNFSGGATPSVQSALLHLCYFSREWYQADPDFLPQTHFVGGLRSAAQGEVPAWLQAIPPDVPLALITLGTAFTGDLGFLSWAAQAAARLRMIPIVVIGTNPIPETEKSQFKASLPAGTRLLNWVDFDQVFPRLKVIIHHGGMGTTHRAIVHGLPQIVVPHAADQRGQARRVAQAKIGLNLNALDIQRGQLLPAIRAVAEDPKVREAASALQASFAALGGAERAAGLLIDLAEGQTQ